jgi:hypothetical protein
MSGLVIAVENGWVDARSVVTDSKPELILIVSNFYLDSAGIRMPNRISCRFRYNPEHFVANDGIEGSCRSFDLDVDLRIPFGG